MTDTYPHWLFDDSPIPDPLGRGERAVTFLRRLRHPKSKASGHAFQLTGWQERIVRRIYGPTDEDGERIVREVFLLIGRGNRKTSLAAGLALLHTIGPERVPAGQNIFAAGDRRQAGLAFREAAGVIRMDPRLVRATKVHDAYNAPKTILFRRDGSTLEAIAADGARQHGTTPSFVLCDEIHAWRANGRDLWEALQSGMAKRTGGLTITATTAGRGREGLAAERYAYARKVASGEVVNPHFLPILLQLDEEDDWTDEALWPKANPGIRDGFHDMKKLRADVAEARDNPAKAHEFQQFYCNIWHGNSRLPLFDFDTFDARRFEDAEEELEGLPCYLGVDYAQSGDLAAIVAAWRMPDGQVPIKAWFFVPEEGLEERERLEGNPYAQWIDSGFVVPVPGPVVTQAAVAGKVLELAATHDVQGAAFDPWKFQAAAAELTEEGVPMLAMRQAIGTMGPANGELIRTVNGRLIRHDGNPVLRAHFAGVAAKVNDTGMTMLTKADPKHGHIDGAIAASMAVSRACAAETTRSAYNEAEDGLFVF